MRAIAGMPRSYQCAPMHCPGKRALTNPGQTNPARRFSSIRSPWARISPPAR